MNRIQRYKINPNNKFYSRMPRIFMPEEMRNKLTFSSQTILFYVISTLPQLDDDSELHYRNCQELVLHYKYFVDNKILSNKKFYEGLNQLIELEYLLTDPELPKNVYICNPYYIDNMNKRQRAQMNADIRYMKAQDIANNMKFTQQE